MSSRQKQIWNIVENDLPDSIGITPEEYYNTGWEYETGFFIFEINDSLAVRCYERAASKGMSKAMTALAKLYTQNEDLEKAYYWCLEATLGGDDAEAFYILGNMYHKGEFLEQDYQKALRYYSISLDMGFWNAAYYLGLYAESGYMRPVNMDEARRYYQIGAKAHEKRCLERLRDLEIHPDQEGTKDAG